MGIGATGYGIKCEDIPNLEKEALTGSKEAAIKLVSFFSLIPDSSDDSIYWATIGAENGDISSQQALYGELLSLNDNPAAQTRARFWLNKVAQEGGKSGEDAKSTLQRLDAKNSNK